MKKVILVALFFPVAASGQLTDDFETGSLTGWVESIPGRWCADTDQALKGLFSLRHCYDNPASGSDCIGVPVSDFHPEEGALRWSFLVRHGSDPSSSNNWAVFLMSDKAPEDLVQGGLPDGYAAGVNLSGYDDTLRLWKVIKGVPEVLLSTGVNWQSDVSSGGVLRLEIERSRDGAWKFFVRDKNDSMLDEVSVNDSWLPDMNWFLIFYRYSSTRDRLLWFDDLHIEGVFYSDTTAPSVVSCLASSDHSLILTFSENINYDDLKESDFYLNNSCEALIVNKLTDSAFELAFDGCLINKTNNTLTINKLCDRSGNCLDAVNYDFVPAWAEPGDIIISEIMADPLPPVRLPACEYLELYNLGPYSFSLEGWELHSGNDKIILPESIIPAGSYMILCHVTDTSLLRTYGRCLGLKTFPALTDSGKRLVLCDTSGTLIHGLHYTSDWYGSPLKTNGGWSLELIDTDYPFYYEGNWEASSSRDGGTPGRPNHVSRSNPDQLFRGLENVFARDSLTVGITFSEPLIMTSQNSGIFFSIDGKPVRSSSAEDPLQMSFAAVPGEILAPGKIYRFEALGFSDFAGNELRRSTFEFGLAEAVLPGDIRFNELMFDPLPGDPDFIEFYNNSGRIVNAATLYMASVNTEGDTSGLLPLSAYERTILPGSYYVITSDRDKILERFPGSDEAYIFETQALPSMPDGGGILLLFDRALRLIDRVSFSPEMHHPLIDISEGISLEKIRTGLDSNDPSAWHSAAESSGWASPGRPNSVSVPGSPGSDQISFSSERISPDNDGYEDVLVIDFRLQGQGNIISVSVFDEAGRLILKLRENFLAGPEASVTWDGSTGSGSIAGQGIYIIHIVLFDEKGKTSIRKKALAVISGRK